MLQWKISCLFVDSGTAFCHKREIDKDKKNLFFIISILQAIVGPLSSDFLRLENQRDIQESADRQAAIALYQQQNVAPYMVSFT